MSRSQLYSVLFGVYLGNRFSGIITPLAPSGLTVTVIDDTTLKLDYIDNSHNEAGFKIERSNDLGLTYSVIATNLPSVITYTNENLIQGTQYYYRVRAYKGSKYSVYSNVANATTTLSAPTVLTSQFVVDTILGQVDFTDNTGGVAQYEIYSNTNTAGAVLLTTLATGIVTYSDTTCKQNASVVYTIRAKKGSVYSDYTTATALVTPLCWKTNQATRTNVVINSLIIAAGKTVNIDWGDGSNANFVGSNTNITKTYAASAVNVFNIKFSGDTNSITGLQHHSQIKSFGSISNWVLPSASTVFIIFSTSFSGDISGWVLSSALVFFRIHANPLSGNIGEWLLPGSLSTFSVYATSLSGKNPNIIGSATAMDYQAYSCSLLGTNTAVFRRGMTGFNISNQNVIYPTSEIDELLKAAADWYENNVPTANCTYNMSGANMGIPTGGASNIDLVRLAGYYTAAGFTATIVIRTS